jgi:hypothetical protein
MCQKKVHRAMFTCFLIFFLQRCIGLSFTVGGNGSKSGLLDVLFDMRPIYLLVNEIEHLKPEYQTTLLSLMETGILTQTMTRRAMQYT